MQKEQWYNNLYLTSKTAHEDNIIGIKKHNQQTFLTSSEDCTIRLWDIRLRSSVKLIKNKVLSHQMSNPASDLQSIIFVGSYKTLYSFDLRQSQIFIQQINKQCQQKHLDDINRIKYSQMYKQITCCDDEGDIWVYDAQNMKCCKKLQQAHNNICNDFVYINSDHKDFTGKKICVSGGFDSTLIIWDTQIQKPIKTIPIEDILKKYQIKASDPPFIHQICCHNSSVLLGLQTGHIICIPIYEPKKPKFIMETSLTQITNCSLVNFDTNPNKKFLLTADAFNTFSLYDFQQRVNKQPKFLTKYKLEAKPVEFQIMGNILLAACVSPKLSFFSLKQ